MKYTVVLPFAYQEYAYDCIRTMKFDSSSVLMVDNTIRNLGIMKSHNMGIDKMIADKSDWLVVVSAAIRFGEPGGLDFIKALEESPDKTVIESEGVFGWHLIAFRKEVFEKIGRWDENFTPYGYDDIDLSWRIQLGFDLVGKGQVWTKVPVDLKDMGMNHGVRLGNVELQDEAKLRKYFFDKWGGITPPKYKHPFNDKNNSVKYCPEPGDPKGINGN